MGLSNESHYQSHHRLCLYYHFSIVSSSSFDRSYRRHRTIVVRSRHHRSIVLSSSHHRSHHRIIIDRIELSSSYRIVIIAPSIVRIVIIDRFVAVAPSSSTVGSYQRRHQALSIASSHHRNNRIVSTAPSSFDRIAQLSFERIVIIVSSSHHHRIVSSTSTGVSEVGSTSSSIPSISPDSIGASISSSTTASTISLASSCSTSLTSTGVSEAGSTSSSSYRRHRSIVSPKTAVDRSYRHHRTITVPSSIAPSSIAPSSTAPSSFDRIVVIAPSIICIAPSSYRHHRSHSNIIDRIAPSLIVLLSSIP